MICLHADTSSWWGYECFGQQEWSHSSRGTWPSAHSGYTHFSRTPDVTLMCLLFSMLPCVIWLASHSFHLSWVLSLFRHSTDKSISDENAFATIMEHLNAKRLVIVNKCTSFMQPCKRHAYLLIPPKEHFQQALWLWYCASQTILYDCGIARVKLSFMIVVLRVSNSPWLTNNSQELNSDHLIDEHELSRLQS